MSKVTWLVDISNWQGNINIGQIAREGYAACVCKATEGTGFRDGWFDTYIPKVKAAGMIPGAYHYLRAGNGAAQARFFYDRVRKHGGPAGWIIQLDCESDGLGREMTDWANEWKRLTGGHPFLIYSGAWWWPRTGGFRGAKLTPYLWQSHYVSGSGYGSVLYQRVPASWWRPGYGGWSEATILQFSSRGKVAGQLIDVNAFRGTVDELRRLLAPGAGAKPAPKPAPAATPVASSGKTHKVVKGDTLSGIAGRYGTSVAKLLSLNPSIKNPNLIYPGQRIKLPSGAAASKPTPKDTHTVAKGDTLWGIARKYKTTVAKLMRLNPGIRNADLIFPGQKIRLR